MMGEVVGMAASLCKKHNTTPRGVYKDHLGELKSLMKRGVGKAPVNKTPAPPKWLASAGPNLARSAKVTVSSSHSSGRYKASRINDGQAAPVDNNLRWVSDARPPHRVELTWGKPQTIGAARIVTGWNQGGRITGVIEDFSLQYHDSGEWKDVPSAKVTANRLADWSARFKPVKTKRLRLTITATPGDIARIWELEVYNTLTSTKTGV